MRQLVLTGIAQETSLQDPDNSYYLLVFNDGEVRVPTSEDGVTAVLSALSPEKVESEPEREPASDIPEGAAVFSGGESSDYDSPPGWQPDPDGVVEYDDDINDGVGQV